MRTASDVKELVTKWIAEGRDKTYIIINAAEACLGWPYVWGAVGSECTPSRRQYYAGRDVCPEGEKKVIISGCQALNGSGKSCGGCVYYPDNMRTLCSDCQGFVKNICGRVGISFSGGGCTSMWNGSGNWERKGTRDTLPEQLCCVFWQDQKDPAKMRHIGFYVGNGMMIHCSGSVKKEKLSSRVTHWAIPKGLSGAMPIIDKPTLRRGASGAEVMLMQSLLIRAGYNLDPYGADGKYGAKTEAAVKAYQRDNQLTADGICGQRTWSKLLEVEEKPAGKLYTITIPHCTKDLVDKLKQLYAGVEANEEE